MSGTDEPANEMDREHVDETDGEHADELSGEVAVVDESFFRRRAVDVARDLVGMELLVEPGDADTTDAQATDDGAASAASPVGGIVTETEAYVAHVDPACHLAAGRTDRTEPFFAGPGTVYVYTIWGHHNLNVITAYEGHPEGVLIRAVEPTRGLETMRERRGVDDETKLTTGPGRLTEALGVTKGEFDGRPLSETGISIRRTGREPDVAVGPRIGISEAADWPLRFCLAGSRFLSKPVPEDPELDYGAVEAAYDELAGTNSPLVDN